MASKYKREASSIYIAGTNIPQNKYTIDNAAQIHQLEKELIEEAYITFHAELNKETVFDEVYFINLHKRTFGELYEWAGAFRDFNMSKGDSVFCQGEFIASESAKIFKSLKEDNYLRDYEDKPKEAFAKKLAYYKCELNALHPFYELNGRITRMFFDMIVAYNGYVFIDYSHVSPETYIDAAIECVQFASSSEFEEIILKGLSK